MIAVLVVLLVTVVGGLRLLGGRAQHVSVGQRFPAASPWRLQVAGHNCAVRVSSTDGRVTNAGHGSNYSLQMRSDGEFVVNELTPGCTASVAAGAGQLARLPMTLEPGRDGTGGDSPPFRSPGGFRVLTEGGDCRTQVYRAADGSQVEEFQGTARWEYNQSGSFYVHSEPGCRTQVEAI